MNRAQFLKSVFRIFPVNFPEFFLQIFEVFEEFRNQKFGEKILESLQEKFEKLILETEPDSLSEIAERRLRFYERNGFSVIEKNYLQPSYGEGKYAVNLFLMTLKPFLS